MTKAYGGTVIDLGRGGEFGMVNPLEIVMDYDDEDTARGSSYSILTKSLQTLKAFMKYYAPNIEEDVLTLFIGVVQDTYARFGIRFDSNFMNFRSDQFPTFQDVYATVNGNNRKNTRKRCFRET